MAVNVDYDQEIEKIKEYMDKQVLIPEIVIDLQDIQRFDQDLCEKIEGNAKTFTRLFYKVVDGMNTVQVDDSPLQVLLQQRRERGDFPTSLTRNYSIQFKPRSKKQYSVREIKGELVGNLVQVKGMITRVSNVKPLCTVACYSCDRCGNEVFQEITTQTWMPLQVCPSEQCQTNNVKGRLFLQTRGCKFLKFQKVKLQELTDQVPMGHIPRSMTVYLTESQTRKVNPGEVVVISGIILPIPFTGYKALRAGLITDTYLEAHHVLQLKQQYRDMSLTDEISEQIRELASQPGVYDRLASSIAPEIYGHEDVKKALLLMLVGGTNRTTEDGMKVRGDLNICLMGDPGVAKSQLLKHICKIAPRAVYTTGRGSSGVGLTASVTRDPVTEEMVLEGGALVLADNGIACIDEFDKMDESDRTAIHEVMEQQTISISKAGINTTLNARTSILAAANPQYGRYNLKKKPTENINLPAALLSRFDLLFLLVDKPSVDSDLQLAQHVTHVHRTLSHPSVDQNTLNEQLIKNYISLARNYQPLIPSTVGDYIVNAYVHMRKNAHDTSEFQYTCARTLLSIVRLASALARLRFAEEIQISDVDEALRLIEVSTSSLQPTTKKARDPVTAIFEMIKEMSTRGNGVLEKEISISDIRERVISKGLTESDLERCIRTYAEDDIWMTCGADNSRLRWIMIEDNEE